MSTFALSNQKHYRHYKNTSSSHSHRQTALKKQMLAAVIVFAIVIAGIFIGGSLIQAHQAQASNVYENVVYYKSIEVKNGDTLWTIADKYMGNKFHDKKEYIEEVKRLNHLSDDTIHTGAYLMIPYSDTVSGL